MRKRRCRIVRIREENKDSGIARRVMVCSLWYFMQDASDRGISFGRILVVANIEHECVDKYHPHCIAFSLKQSSEGSK